ncbi:MAG: thioredoxin domain-containing protein, partial [Anaerolineae bacterium]|nr:thioredoxin domain-containing protein [Anaerolineae bacterium]
PATTEPAAESATPVADQPTATLTATTAAAPTEPAVTGDTAAAEPTSPRYAAPAPTPASLSGDVAASLGDPGAPVTIVEFTDYQCPYCARYSQETLPRVRADLVETGLVYYQLKDLPLDIHPQAPRAAAAARCAGEQDAYWEMHDALFANQTEWASADGVDEAFGRLAVEIGLDSDPFDACVESERYAQAVQDNLSEAAALGVSGAPSFFIDGYPVRGAQPFELFEYAVALAQEGALGDAYRRPLPEISGGAFAFGNPDAPVVMIEFTDYQCPFCARYATETQGRIIADYVDTGQVYYVIKDFPIRQIHPLALDAAQTARCAGEQDAYLAMHDLLFAEQGTWSSAADGLAAFSALAEELGLDTDAFSACLTSGKYEEAVLANFEEGAGVGVSGTPAFFVGTEFVDGAQPYEAFAAVLDAQLGGR